MPTVQKKDNTSTQNPLKHWKVTCHNSYVFVESTKSNWFLLGLRNYHLKTSNLLSMFVHVHSTWPWDKSSISPAASGLGSWKSFWVASCTTPSSMITCCLAMQHKKPVNSPCFFKSTPHDHMPSPLDLSPRFVRVQVPIVVPRWRFWKWMCLGVWVLEMHVRGETLSIVDWLITRFGHVIPADALIIIDTCCVPFVSTIHKPACDKIIRCTDINKCISLT